MMFFPGLARGLVYQTKEHLDYHLKDNNAHVVVGQAFGILK